MLLAVSALSAALVLAAPRVAHRLPRDQSEIRSAKTPRDGPRPTSDRTPINGLRIAADIELFAACLRAGRSVVTAVDVIASTYGADDTSSTDPTSQRLAHGWRHAAALYALGASPATAWQELEHLDGLREIASLVKLSSASGASLADGCDRVAATLHNDAADHATARAERAGVLIAIPLALCFLPAFFLLGLAPVVISLGTELIP